MKLNHVNLTVTDVPQTRRLFETYFGLTPSREGGSENFDVMFDDGGSVITLMKCSRRRVIQAQGWKTLRARLAGSSTTCPYSPYCLEVERGGIRARLHDRHQGSETKHTLI
jgi:catechol 2,3-dioxygenase-like lactoylglutathione lyase family enzyme